MVLFKFNKVFIGACMRDSAWIDLVGKSKKDKIELYTKKSWHMSCLLVYNSLLESCISLSYLSLNTAMGDFFFIGTWEVLQEFQEQTQNCA